MLCNFERTSVEDIGQKEKERETKRERESVYYYSAIVMLLCSRLHQI